jgi:hypothetical protein
MPRLQWKATCQDGVKRFAQWQAGRFGNPGFDPGSSEKGKFVIARAQPDQR